MPKIFNVLSTLRNHWKKSLFLFGCSAYGVNYGFDQYEIDLFMTELCKEAAVYGDQKYEGDHSMKHICVILNPAANKRSAKKNFDKFCAPILHLSGSYVTVLESEREGDARKLVGKIDPKTNVLVVAGGDGTLSETITGLMRMYGDMRKIPVGVIPLGQFNTLANAIFPEEASLCAAKKIGKATIAVIQGRTKDISTYKVELLNSQNDKSVYGAGLFEWGRWPSFKKRLKDSWFMGPLGKYYALLFPNSGMKEAGVHATIRYSEPCAGCSNCYSIRPDLHKPVSQVKRRWWSNFILPVPVDTGPDYTKIENINCSRMFEKNIHATDLRIRPDLSSTDDGELPKLYLNIGPSQQFQGELFRDGLKYLNNEVLDNEESAEAKEIEIHPINSLPVESENVSNDETKKGNYLLIDNEEYDVRSVKVTILPRSFKVFCGFTNNSSDVKLIM